MLVRNTTIMVFLQCPFMLTTSELYVRKTFHIFLLSLLLLGGCASGIDPELYRTQEPAFDVAGFFTGDIKARGIVQNRSAVSYTHLTLPTICSV